jgi:Dolichyl-phosphate-mannose-protein mannosyltransferase
MIAQMPVLFLGWESLAMRYVFRVLTSLSLIVVVAFALRVGIFWTEQHGARAAVITNAPFGYETGAIAASIARGQGFSSPLSIPSGPTAWLTPVFPYLLAAIFKWFGVYSYPSYVLIVVLDCLFSALTCIPVFFISARLGGTAAAAIAAWTWAFYGQAINIPIEWVWDTSLAALLCATVLWATLKIRDSTRTEVWAGYGALWAFAIMVNAALASVAPFVMLWLGWPSIRRRFLRRAPASGGASLAPRWPAAPLSLRLRLPVVATLVLITGCLPWTTRNFLVFHRLIPLRSNFGLELWLGNNPRVPGTWAGWLHPSDNVAERKKFMAMGEIAYVAQKQHEALAFMAAHPRDASGIFLHHFFENWLGSGDPLQDVWRARSWQGRFGLVLNLVSVLGGFCGLLLLFRQRSEWAWPMALFPLLFPIVYYLTHPTRRYRHPIDPVLIVLTAFVVSYPLRLLASRRGSEDLAPEPVGAS